MTVNRKAPKPKRTNKNRHYRSMLIPKVQELIDVLRSDWDAMGFSERGKRLDRLILSGCSRRGIGKELGVSATSIRRHLEIAHLPEADRKAIAGGASAKKTLLLKANADRQSKKQQRIDQDQKTGALSDKTATSILEFCRTGRGLDKDPMIGRIFPMLLDQVASRLRQFEESGHRSVKVSKKLEVRELFKKARPRAAKPIAQLVHQAEWLAEVLWLIAPESPIRASAILKARRRVGELSNMTPCERYEDAYWNSVARSKERANIPPRPFHPGGAKSMPRQGVPTRTSKSK